MKEKLKENVNTLNLEETLIDKMEKNKNLTIEDLWKLKRKDLKELPLMIMK